MKFSHFLLICLLSPLVLFSQQAPSEDAPMALKDKYLAACTQLAIKKGDDLAMLKKYIDSVEVLGDTVALYEVYNLISYDQGSVGNLEIALPYCDTTLQLSLAHRDSLYYSEILNTKARILSSLGRTPEAMGALLESIRMLQLLKEQESRFNFAYANLAIMYVELGEEERALTFIEHAVNQNNDSTDLQIWQNTLCAYAGILLENHRLDKADSIINLIDPEQLENESFSALISVLKLGLQADLAYERGDYDKSIRFQKNARTINDAFGGVTGVELTSSIAIGLSKTWLQQNYPDSAIAVLTQFIDEPMMRYFPNSLISVYDLYSEAHYQSGNFEIAYEYLKMSKETQDSIDEITNASQIRQVQLKSFESDNLRLQNLNIQRKARADVLQRKTDLLTYFILFLSLTLITLSILVYRLQLTKRRLRTSRNEVAIQAAELDEINQNRIQLMSILGHDLRGPLSSVVQLMKLYHDRAFPTEKFDEAVPDLINSLTQTQNTLEELLEWSILNSDLSKSKFSNVHLTQVVDNVFDELNILASQKKVVLKQDIPNDCMFNSDQRFMTIILRNIIQNALKYTSDGYVEVNCEQQNDFLTIRIKDSGIGMTEDVISTIMAQANDTSKMGTAGELGYGLGLKFSISLVKKLRGDIQISSKPGEGSEFTLTFPITAQ